jgi:SAM-dependent methyltransferase
MLLPRETLPRKPLPKPQPLNRPPASRKLPTTFKLAEPPKPLADVWSEPPSEARTDEVVRSVWLEMAPPPDRYNVELLEALNAEYQDRPLVPNPQSYDVDSLSRIARGRLKWVHEKIDLLEKRVLEIGCGNGLELWHLSHDLGCDAYGVDVREFASWPSLSDGRTHFVMADMAVENPYAENFFERIFSFTVWEHVVHPFRMLQEMFNVMKPGGLAWIRANLHRGPSGSHLYRDIHFPWPHLLFSDDVIKEFYRRRDEPEQRPLWVNNVTWAEYERYFELIGFVVRLVSFTERPIDEELYLRFEDELSRYPRFDLTKDFFTVILEKPSQ